jgi:hypothetical protein
MNLREIGVIIMDVSEHSERTGRRLLRLGHYFSLFGSLPDEVMDFYSANIEATGSSKAEGKVFGYYSAVWNEDDSWITSWTEIREERKEVSQVNHPV